MKLFGEDKYYNNALKFLGAVAPDVRSVFCSEFDWSLAGYDDAFTCARRDTRYIKKADGRTPDGFEVFRQNKDKFGYIDGSGVVRAPTSAVAASRYPVATAYPSSDYVSDDITDDALAKLVAQVGVARPAGRGGASSAAAGATPRQARPSVLGGAGMSIATPRPDPRAAKARAADSVLDPKVMKAVIMECCGASGNRIKDKQVSSFVSLVSDQLTYLEPVANLTF